MSTSHLVCLQDLSRARSLRLRTPEESPAEPQAEARVAGSELGARVSVEFLAVPLSQLINLSQTPSHFARP